VNNLKRWIKNPKKENLYRKLKINFEKSLEGTADDWNWPTVGYLSATSLIKLFALNDIYKKILNTPGHIVEFGSFFGTNTLLFQNLKNIYEPHYNRRIYSFDRFIINENIIETDSKFNYFTFIDAFSILKSVSLIHHLLNCDEFNEYFTSFIDGDIETTLPKLLTNDKDFSIALIYIDVDSHVLTEFILRQVNDRLLPGSIVIIEGFLNKNTEGIAIETRKFISQNNKVGPIKRLGMTNYLVTFDIL
jgi:hypothetical protein